MKKTIPTKCLFDKVDNCYVISNDQLDIIATGKTQKEAENNFNEDFNFLYIRLNSLNDNQLSERLISIKSILNNIVDDDQ